MTFIAKLIPRSPAWATGVERIEDEVAAAGLIELRDELALGVDHYRDFAALLDLSEQRTYGDRLAGPGRAGDEEVLALKRAGYPNAGQPNARATAQLAGKFACWNEGDAANMYGFGSARPHEKNGHDGCLGQSGEHRSPRCVVPVPGSERAAEIILVIEKGVHAGDGVAASAIRERREGQRNLLGEKPRQKPLDEVAVCGGTAVMSGPVPDQTHRHLDPERRSQEDVTERLSESELQRSKQGSFVNCLTNGGRHDRVSLLLSTCATCSLAVCSAASMISSTRSAPKVRSSECRTTERVLAISKMSCAYPSIRWLSQRSGSVAEGR